MDIRQFALLQGKFSKMISPSPAGNPTRRVTAHPAGRFGQDEQDVQDSCSVVCKTIGTRVRISCQSSESCLNSRQTQQLPRRRWPQGLLSLALALLLLSCQAAPTPPVIAPDPFASNPRATPISAAGAPAQGSTANEQPPSTWQIYASAELSITLTYPAHWRPAASDDIALFRGEDGFFGLSAAHMVAETAEAVCAEWVQRDPNPRPISQPPIEPLQVAGQPACLILPTDDQSQPDGEALLFVQYPRAYEHSRTLILIADMAHIRQIAASLRFALPPQTLDSLRGALTYVELDIFSGRPNPVWSLPDAQRQELLTRLAGLSPGTPAPYPGRLGYRGLLVHFNLPPYGMPETIQIFQRTVCYELGGTRTCRVDPGRGIERWLLETADRSQVDVELLDGILGEMSAVATVEASAQPKTRSYASPDEQWRVDIKAIACVPTADGGANAYETLSLVRSDGTGAAVVDSQLINCGGLGAYGLGGLFWSPNSRYFYYTTAREGVPDGCGYWQPPVWRLDITSGAIQELGGGSRSPDGTKFTAWLNQELVLWDIDGGELGRWPAVAPDAARTALAWLPDSRAVAYLLAPSPCAPHSAGKSYVVSINAADLSQSVLLATDTPTFIGLEWKTANVIRLFDDEDKSWLLDGNGLKVETTP